MIPLSFKIIKKTTFIRRYCEFKYSYNSYTKKFFNQPGTANKNNQVSTYITLLHF